jgi:hypothetical protein
MRREDQPKQAMTALQHALQLFELLEAHASDLYTAAVSKAARAIGPTDAGNALVRAGAH